MFKHYFSKSDKTKKENDKSYLFDSLQCYLSQKDNVPTIFDINSTNLHTCVKGKQLKDILLYKITNFQENHNEFQYKTGVNIDEEKFRPEGDCMGSKATPFRGGGLYFCQLIDILRWINYGNIIGYYIRKVKLEEDEPIYIEEHKFKAHKIILEEREILKDFITKELCYMILLNNKNNGELLKYIPEHIKESITKEILEYILKNDIKNKSQIEDYINKNRYTKKNHIKKIYTKNMNRIQNYRSYMSDTFAYLYKSCKKN